VTGFKDEQLQEKLEVLYGSRGGPSPRAAVRIEDIEALLQLPEKLRAEKIDDSAELVEISADKIIRNPPADFTIASTNATNRTTLPSAITLTGTKTVGSSPTGVEFNRVIDDLAAIRAFCLELSVALRDAPTVTHMNRAVQDLTSVRTFCLALKIAVPQASEFNKVIDDLGQIITYLTAVPDAERFNALVSDNQAQLERLREVADALQKRVLP